MSSPQPPPDEPSARAEPGQPALNVRRRAFAARTVAVAIHRGNSSEVPRALLRWRAQVAAAGLEVCGAPLAIFSSGDRELDTVPVRLCVPVAAEGPAELGVRSATLDAVEVIEVRYQGPYSGIGAAYDALCQWLEGCELCVAQGVSETVRQGPGDDQPDGAWTIDVAMRLCTPTSSSH